MRFSCSRAGESVSAHVIKDFRFARPQTAIALEAGLIFTTAQAPAGEENFIAGKRPLHGTTRLTREQGDHGLDTCVVLAAVAAADEGHYDAHAVQRQFEYLRQLFLQR
jgi:hypothetical protein